MIRSHDYNQAQEPRTVGVGVGDQQQEGGEKKSVLKKVKDKAKKIKETIKKRGQHGHDHESDQMNTPPDDHDLDEEDSDSDSGSDEEILEDPAVHGPPEIHGAPMYESGAGTTDARTRQPEELSRLPGVADERAFLGGRGKGKSGGLGRTGGFLETPQNTSSHRQEATFVPATVESPEQRNVHLEIPRGMEEDHAANTDRTSSYQSKLTDLTGRGEEVRDLTPMIDSFGKLGMREEQNRGEKQSMSAGELPLSTGSHDQFKPEPTSVINPTSNYQSKVTDPTARGEEARDITPMIRSFGKLGMRDEDENRGEKQSMSAGELPGSHDPEPATVPEQQVVENSESERQSPRQGGYMSSIASTAASLGTSLMSRVVGSGTATETETITGMDSLQESEGGKPKQSSGAGAGTGTGKIVGPGNQTSQETMEVGSGSGEGKGMSMSSYLSEKLKPGEEDEALSKMISEKLLMKKREETHEDGEEGSDDPVKGGNGMVDKLRGAVGSWFSKPHPTQDSGTYNEAVEQKMGLGEEEKEKERQLQESGN